MVVDQNFLKVKRFAISILLLVFTTTFSLAENLNFKKIVNLNSPWGSTFINNDELLITEKSGKIKLIDINSKKYFPSDDIVVNMDGGVGGSWSVKSGSIHIQPGVGGAVEFTT